MHRVNKPKNEGYIIWRRPLPAAAADGMPRQERNTAYIRTLTTELASAFEYFSTRHRLSTCGPSRTPDAALSSLSSANHTAYHLKNVLEPPFSPAPAISPPTLLQTGRIQLGGEVKVGAASLTADNMSPIVMGGMAGSGYPSRRLTKGPRVTIAVANQSSSWQ